MKKKLLYTSIAIVVAVIGLFALQADWLIKTYNTEKENKANAADTALRRALTKFHRDQNDSIRKLLTPLLSRIGDSVSLTYSMPGEPPTLTIKLHGKTPSIPKGMQANKYFTARAFGRTFKKEETNVERSKIIGNINVEYDYQTLSQGPPMTPVEAITKGPKFFLEYLQQDKVAIGLEQIFGDPKGERSKFYFSTDSARIIQLIKLELDKMGETMLSKTIHLRFKYGDSAPTHRDKQFSSFYKPYRAQGLNGYYGQQRLVAVSYASLPNIIALSLLMHLSVSGFLMFVLIFSIVYLIKLILQQKQLAEMKDDFINNLTHEFKTPIATVSAAIEGLQKFNAINDKEKTERYLNISRTELNRLNDMVTKVLNISSYEKKDLKLDKESVDLEAVLNEVTQMEQLKGVKPVRFSVNIAPDVRKIFADPLHIKNVLGNLIDNAVKYSKDSVDISITAYRDKNTVAIKIKDNGIGIAAKDLKFIFDKFYRVTDGNLYNTKGNGLGLNYVRSIIEAHGGTVTAKSEINTGTEFIITLPLNNG